MSHATADGDAVRRSGVDALYIRGRRNSLNLVRLILASFVILWHTYAVLGAQYPEGGIARLLGDFPVNGFFAVSGFLIYQSWVRKPSASSFLLARAVRIYPAFWMCLLVTAVLFAPAAAWIQGHDPFAQLWSLDSLTYVLKNASLAMLQWRIGDSPADIPFLTSWDASLWTLAWEFLCYVALMVLGLLGMQRRWWLLPAAFTVSVALNVVSLMPELYFEPVARLGRFSIFFLAGALVAQHARRIPANWAFGLAMTAMAVASAWVPGGILIQAPTVAIGLIVLGGLFNPAWAELRNDISYGVYIYAFPIQQLLVVAGIVALDVFSFSLLALVLTIPLAVLSWFLLEKPALRLRKLDRRAFVSVRAREGTPR